MGQAGTEREQEWIEQLLDAWAANNRVHHLLLDAIDAEGLACTLSKRGGRSVARQFAHVHTVRRWQLEKRAKDLAEGLTVFETRDEPDRKTLKRALDQSARRIATFLEDCAHGRPKRRGFKRGVPAFLGYLIAHESHHRGNILLTLKQCGHPVAKATRYRLWDWDRL